MNVKPPKLSGKVLTKNAIWSLSGATLPMVAGIWFIPILISILGKEKFGLLTIVWMAIGYFSFFDLGIGRALTKIIAEGTATRSPAEVATIATIGLRSMMILGSAAGIIVIAITPWLIDHILRVTPELRLDTKKSFLLLGATLPFVVSNAGQIGILQAHQRFRAIASIRIPLGIFNFVGPVLILPFSTSVAATTAIIAAGRIMAWVGYKLMCRPYLFPRTRITIQMMRKHVRDLLGFGGWITVSNIISPMMVYFDRFFVSALAGLAVVAYYTTPYEIVSRISIIPIAIADVMFSAFARSLADEPLQARIQFIGASKALMSILFPIIGSIILFAPEGLQLWLGHHFSLQSTPVLRWLAIGVFVNSFARLPFALLQAYHRPDLTAKLHLIELPLYVASVYFLTLYMGITGTAMAWAMRSALDALLLFTFSAKIMPIMKSTQIQVATGIGVASLILAGLCTLDAMPYKILALLVIALIIPTIGGVHFLRRKSIINSTLPT